MRVLHVITGLNAGGAEHQLRLLLRHLPDECEVVTLANPGPIASAIRDAGTPVHEVLMRSNTDLAAVPRLARLIRAGRYDVVHTHLYRAGLYGALAARLAGVRNVVATEHSLGDGVIEGRPTTRGVRALYLGAERLTKATVAVSETVRTRLVNWGVPERKIQVIPNGIDAAEFRFDPVVREATRRRLGIPQDAPVVGAVGRLVATKRFDVLVGATAALPEAWLLLVGGGPEEAALREAARERGLADRVLFAGPTAHAREVLCAMDVFASPSPHETFGLAILEALASGLPVAYVACPPLEEAPPAAAPTASRIPLDEKSFQDALRDVLTLVKRRDYTRQPAPPIVARFDIAPLASAVSGLYERVTAPRRSVSPRGPLRSERS
ncbi:glycosyl transferase [Virgisporangium aliadipatigenens]|uniref:Glycosyl transferase n=1 Tax=Virgisporangium aliadipatigenens TaxID=741659 RepID=A0A8J4DTN4_9ACTN|nr:glycosyltransferase [Virgisporangium aliadipatigenens]GIJ49481.1 glycosyl transferase [Virgisporangium aliadipatigenens]